MPGFSMVCYVLLFLLLPRWYHNQFMSSNQNKKYKTPEVLEPIEGKVPNCPNCGILFQEPVSANEDYLCPKCSQPFNVVIRPEAKPSEE